MSSDNACKLFIAGLADSLTEETLRALFTESGAEVTDVRLPRDKLSNRPRGFAFVTLATADGAQRARETLDGRVVGGRAIAVRAFQGEAHARNAEGASSTRAPRNDATVESTRPGPERTLYVGNLPFDTTQDEVTALIESCGVGPVLRVHLPLDTEGRRRGFGFVTLGSTEAAVRAAEALRDTQLRGRRLVVNVAQQKGQSPGAHESARSAPREPTYGSIDSRERARPSEFSAPTARPEPNGRRAFEPPSKGQEDSRRGRAARREQQERWRHDDDDD